MVINIGFGNLVNVDKILSIVRNDSAPVKRIVAQAKEKGCIIDATQGRKTKSVIILDEGHIILSALQGETLYKRISGNSLKENTDAGE